MSLQSDFDKRSTLTSFIGEVVVNADVRSEFKGDPIATASRYGVELSEQQKSILKVVAADLSTACDALDRKLSTEGLAPLSLGCVCRKLNCTVLY
jgi:hypothetical protein